MKFLFNAKPLWLLILYLIVDTICVGMGMGVPIFCIALGLLVGWFSARYITRRIDDIRQVLQKVLRYCLAAAGVTLLAMLAIWGPFTSYLFDPSKDVAKSGIPMILFEPLPSFIGWIVLMILISPFLQLLTSLFSAYLALMTGIKKATYDQKTV